MTHTEISTPLPGIEDAAGRSRIFDHGAHVTAWQPVGEPRPVLWLSSASAYEAGKAIRGGIPICFPWFGPGLTGTMKPAHGFVRAVAWRRAEVTEDGNTVRIDYTIDPDITGSQPEFSHDYRAQLTAEFTPTQLRVTLWAANTGDDPFTLEEALHTYLAVSDVRAISIEGLDGATYLDKNLPDPAFDQVQEGPLQLTGPTDRVHLHSGPVTVVDPGFGRRIRLSSEGSADVVVWNPWEEAAAGMADMGRGEWTGMVCVEAANVFADAVTLRPGEEWTMTQRIEVLPLEK